ncbi:Retrovirus-related Pol polyprotein from transposon TNT 1-94 [Sesamum angolense]|uniref:Retrovirus-related Pol polyprotein from transposon TNT 1-94 n=1 Tax=Sesamum angolense TaxID=2727404 RepID=A0AAE1T694_9LAMI|nr:Retrovirus-related Pol polyprotein from transposon TNT 1-94 [Sesamum angolense]
MTKKPFVGQSTLASGLLDLIHSNVCGPLNTQARGGFSYFITFINDHSRYGYVYLMWCKSETFGIFKEFRLEVETKLVAKLNLFDRSRCAFKDCGPDAILDMARFVGYPKETVGYYFYDPSEQKVFVLRNAVFLKKILKRIPIVRNCSLRNQTYGEAMSNINLRKWIKATKSEMDSMSSNNVWTLVDPPKGVKPVGYKWVYKRKLEAKGEVTTFKARLVMDMKMAFLNEFVEEEIYMDQSEGFTSVGEEQKGLPSPKVHHGLKQASRSWNIHFDEVIRGYDFIKSEFDLVYTTRAMAQAD